MTVVTEVVIMTYFSLKHLNTLTTDQLSGQLFATHAMFLKHLNMPQSYGSGQDPPLLIFNEKSVKLRQLKCAPKLWIGLISPPPPYERIP